MGTSPRPSKTLTHNFFSIFPFLSAFTHIKPHTLKCRRNNLDQLRLGAEAQLVEDEEVSLPEEAVVEEVTQPTETRQIPQQHQLKKMDGSKVTTIKEMFPDWTDEDVVFALQETDGDLETTVDRITDGTITQWGEVSKSKKDRSKSKVKEATTVTSFGDSTNQSRVSRGGRAGFDGARGGRGRATERGGRGGRGRAPTNGVRKENTVETSTPTVESTAWETAPSGESSWDAPKATEDSYDTTKPAQDSWSSTATGAAAATATTAAKVTSSVIPDGVKKSWASIFAPAPAPKKAPEPVVEKPAEPTKVEEPVEAPVPEAEPSIPEPAPVEAVESTAIEEPSAPEPEVQIPPSEDKLTEDNLEQLPDSSNPAPTATVASTKGSW